MPTMCDADSSLVREIGAGHRKATPSLHPKANLDPKEGGRRLAHTDATEAAHASTRLLSRDASTSAQRCGE